MALGASRPCPHSASRCADPRAAAPPRGRSPLSRRAGRAAAGSLLGGEPRGEGARGRVSPRDGPGAPRGRRGSGRAARPRLPGGQRDQLGRRRLQQRVLETRALGRLDARTGKRVATRLLRRPDRADRGARPRGRARTVASPAVQRHGHVTVLVRAQFVRRGRALRGSRGARGGRGARVDRALYLGPQALDEGARRVARDAPSQDQRCPERRSARQRLPRVGARNARRAARRALLLRRRDGTAAERDGARERASRPPTVPPVRGADRGRRGALPWRHVVRPVR
mmetsp:Transcript_5152/g.14564  ORF Transcript_5152/g.14564 Transcript_5152/m.14564 type:complete len:283 (+) Transcript_5152:625-1473(+)